MAVHPVVVLVIASSGYQPLEYEGTRSELISAGVTVVTASDKRGTAVASDGKSTAQVDQTVKELKAGDYAGIFFIGGPGALEHLDNADSYRVIQEAVAAGKPYGGICIAPFILLHAEVLSGKQMTVWDKDAALMTTIAPAGVTYVKQPVVVDGTLVTAPGPQAAHDFGKAIVALLRTQGLLKN